HAEDVRRSRSRRVPAAALRLRPRRPRESRQGDADATPVRRGAGAVPPASARSGGPGGALLMTAEEAAAEIRELEAVRPRGGGTKLGWSPKTDAVDFDTKRL